MGRCCDYLFCSHCRGGAIGVVFTLETQQHPVNKLGIQVLLVAHFHNLLFRELDQLLQSQCRAFTELAFRYMYTKSPKHKPRYVGSALTSPVRTRNEALCLAIPMCLIQCLTWVGFHVWGSPWTRRRHINHCQLRGYLRFAEMLFVQVSTGMMHMPKSNEKATSKTGIPEGDHTAWLRQRDPSCIEKQDCQSFAIVPNPPPLFMLM